MIVEYLRKNTDQIFEEMWYCDRIKEDGLLSEHPYFPNTRFNITQMDALTRHLNVCFG